MIKSKFKSNIVTYYKFKSNIKYFLYIYKKSNKFITNTLFKYN